MRLPVLILTTLLLSAAHAQTVHTHALPFVPAFGASQTGFVRVVNLSGRAGTVTIHATDDTGERFGPSELRLEANQSAHFNSRDLETGNARKRLSPGLGDGDGHWWLEFSTSLDIQALAYIRTPDGIRDQHARCRG